MTLPPVRYRNLDLLADAGRWSELLVLCRTPGAVGDSQRREIAHVIACEAPVEIAAAAVDFLAEERQAYIGPLWEVIADRPWAQLSPHLRDPRARHLAAHSRVLHGEDLSCDATLDPRLLGVPFSLEPWECTDWNAELDVTSYGRRGCGGMTMADFPPSLRHPRPLPPSHVQKVQHDAVALLDAMSPWITACAFRGTAWEAASAVASDRASRQGEEFTLEQAYRALVHLGAAHRPTGRPSGRLWAGCPSGTR
ncbi:hypothetical protein [Embleya sp. NPDC059237]|uniref:hypothetical protein n=1 Tax=Embleya sp. NPDC059237 TaxID=3346784 RepID=UPI0036828F95